METKELNGKLDVYSSPIPELKHRVSACIVTTVAVWLWLSVCSVLLLRTLSSRIILCREDLAQLVGRPKNTKNKVCGMLLPPTIPAD